MDFADIFIKVTIIGVLTLAIFQFVITTQNDNNTANLITNNTLINDSYGNLIGNITSIQSRSDNASQTFGTITPTTNFGIVDVTSVISPTRIFKALSLGTYNVLIALPVVILGVPPIIAGVIDAIIALFIILAIWAVWRGMIFK